MLNSRVLGLLLQASGASMPWWQVISGVLAIPATMLGLVYTYRLYQKTHLEMRRLELEITEKERELGLEKASSPRPPNPDISRSNTSEPHERSRSNDHRLYFILPVVGATIVSLGFAWVMPQPFSLGSPLGPAIRITSVALVAITILVSAMTLRRKSAWFLAAVAIAAFILSMLAAFSFLYLRAQYVVRLDLPDETIEFLAGTTLSSSAKEYLATNPQLTKEELLKNFGFDNANKIWTPESIATIQRSLIGLYVAFIVLGSIFTLTVNQLGLLGWNKRTGKAKPRVALGLANEHISLTSDRLERRSQLEVVGMIASSIEHDLKTPLSSMAMQIRSMKRRFLHDEDVVKRVDNLEHELSRISSIVQIIPLLRADKAYYDRDEFMRKTNMLEVVHRAVRSVKNEQPGLKGNEARSFIKIEGKDVWVRSHAPMLEQVVVNVIKNALEAIDDAEKPHGLIRINVTMIESLRGAFDRWVEVQIEDNGCGIPQQNLDKLTSLFTTRAGRKPNSGLGLFIAKRIMSIHDGEISFESVAKEGARVILRLPEWTAQLKGMAAQESQNN